MERGFIFDFCPVILTFDVWFFDFDRVLA